MGGSTAPHRWLARVRSIRARLTIVACLALAVGCIAGTLVVLSVLRDSLVENLDEAARLRADDIARQLVDGTLTDGLPVHGDEDSFVQVVRPDGEVVAASSNLAGVGPIADLHPPEGERLVRTAYIPVPDEEDDRFHIVALGARDGSGPATVYVVANLDRVKETEEAVARLLRFGLPALVLVVGVICWFVVGRALRPVEAMRAEAAAIGAKDLGRRVPEPATDDEIGRLARTLNDMLARLESSAERQRRFVGDASHELQSPLASSMADLEVALAHPEQARWEETAQGLLSDNQRMSRLVSDLLYVAQADDGTLVPRQVPVDLDDVVAAEIARQRPLGGIAIDSPNVAPAEVRGDPDELRRVVRNLLDNACRYALSTVTVELSSTGRWARLVVADDGPGVPADSRDRIFERFARLDDSRSRGTGGTGLGLAIAREIVERHGGTIELEPVPAGSRFVVRLPTT